RIKDTLKILYPLNILYTRSLESFLLGVFVAFPDGDMLIGFSDKQDFPKLLIWEFRAQHENGFFLINSGKIKQVIVLPKSHGPVRIGRHDVVGMEDGQGLWQ